MSELDKQREAFERWITKPPFEHTCTRKGADSAWPGSYHDIETELAWEAWKELYYQAAKRERELVDALCTARDRIEHWAAYFDDYFREKWDLTGDLLVIDEALAKADAQENIDE